MTDPPPLTESTSMSRSIVRLAAALITVSLVAVAAPASAHVTVSTPDGAQGGFGKLVLRVPTESDDASTERLTVTLPEDTPFAFVTARSKPGWTVELDRKTLDKPVTNGDYTVSDVVRSVTWTADDGSGVPPGQFDEFEISVGPFPSEQTLSFPAEQGYDDGTVVAWDEASTGDEEPAHPAPTLTLAKGSGDGHHAADAPESDDTGGADTVARVLGGIGVLIGAAGVLVALRQNRRRA